MATKATASKSHRPTIFELMPEVMRSLGAITKDQKNTFDGYAFRGIDDVLNAIHGPLSKHGVFCLPKVLTFEQSDRATSKGGTQIHTRLTVEYTFYAPDGSSVVAVAPGEAMDRADKSVNKAMSAAFKYLIFQAFAVPTEQQEDADATTPEVTAPKEWQKGHDPEPPSFENAKPSVPNHALLAAHKLTPDLDVGGPPTVEELQPEADSGIWGFERTGAKKQLALLWGVRRRVEDLRIEPEAVLEQAKKEFGPATSARFFQEIPEGTLGALISRLDEKYHERYAKNEITWDTWHHVFGLDANWKGQAGKKKDYAKTIVHIYSSVLMKSASDLHVDLTKETGHAALWQCSDEEMVKMWQATDTLAKRLGGAK